MEINQKTIFYGIPLLLGGIAYALGVIHGTVEPNHGSVDSESATSKVLALQRENQRLNKELDRLSSRKAQTMIPEADPKFRDLEPVPERWERLRQIAELTNKRYANVQIEPILRDGTLAEDFKELFVLTHWEEQELQRSVDDAQRTLSNLAASKATIVSGSDAEVIIEIPPFIDEGAQIHDSLMQTFSQVLGPERNDALISLSGNALERTLNQFGAEVRRVTVSRGPTAAAMDYDEQYSVLELRTTDSWTMSTTTTRADIVSLRYRYGEEIAEFVQQHFLNQNTQP